MKPTDDQLTGVLRTMLVSRIFDDRCADLLAAGEPLPHYHSGVGQEALMVSSVAPLRPADRIIYTHRGYGHLLAKGVPLREIALDLFFKAGGTNHGLGGVMHVNRPDLGVPGREGVFGTRFGIAAGLGLAAKLRDDGRVTVCFYGEAAGSRGQLYEALNMCKLWRLPVVFVAENNGWSYTSRTEWLYPDGRMSTAWSGFVPVDVFDGNDAEVVWERVAEAVERARQGGGPSVLEALTYRVAPHIWFDDPAYQPAEERERWRADDPVDRTVESLTRRGVAPATLDGVRAAAESEVDEAFAAARTALDAGWSDVEEWIRA